MDFDHILNWKLLTGSHDFPGPDGGTCINEAAIIAAGFEYRAVQSANDCPPCFSRVIAQYAINLNDRMPDGLRQTLLMPFVTRLAGTADSPKVERARIEYIVIQTVRRVLPIALRATKIPFAIIERCKAAKTLADARAAADAANAAAYAAYAANAAADAAADAAAYAANAAVFTEAVKILDEAIALGKQADALDHALVVERLDAARAVAHV